MSILSRYIAANVVGATLVVLTVLLSLVTVFAFIDELGEVKGGYGIWHAASYILLTIPRRIYELTPVAALIGCLIGLGNLAAHSELVAMRAGNRSKAYIIRVVMVTCFVMVLVVSIFGETVAPWLEKNASSQRSLIQGREGAQISRHGIWHRQDNEYIHISSVQSDGQLIGIRRYITDEKQSLTTAGFSTSAMFKDGQWHLLDTTETHFDESLQKTEKVHIVDKPWAVTLSPQVLLLQTIMPTSLSVFELWEYSHYLDGLDLNSGNHWLAFWKKICQPLVTLSLVLLAVAVIFGPLRSVSLGQRIFAGVAISVIFQILQQLLGPASLVLGFSSIIAVLVPAIISALLGWYWLKRQS